MGEWFYFGVMGIGILFTLMSAGFAVLDKITLHRLIWMTVGSIAACILGPITVGLAYILGAVVGIFAIIGICHSLFPKDRILIDD